MARPKVVRLRKPKVDCDSTFIATLVHILDRARAGEVKGYAMVFTLVADTGLINTVQAASAVEARYEKLALLGAIRVMERRFVDRELPEPEDPGAY